MGYFSLSSQSLRPERLYPVNAVFRATMQSSWATSIICPSPVLSRCLMADTMLMAAKRAGPRSP